MTVSANRETGSTRTFTVRVSHDEHERFQEAAWLSGEKNFNQFVIAALRHYITPSIVTGSSNTEIRFLEEPGPIIPLNPRVAKTKLVPIPAPPPRWRKILAQLSA